MPPISKSKTPFHARYGSHPAFLSFAPHKSGITPLSPLHPGISLLSPTSREVRDELEGFQRGVMRGFTSQYLRELDVVPERPFNVEEDIEIGVEVEVLEWIARGRWDLDEGLEGDVKVIWGELEKCLKLVTLLLASVARHPWFDALLLGEREAVRIERFEARDRNRFPGVEMGRCWKVFRGRKPGLVETGETEREMDRIIRNILEESLTFGVMRQDTNPITGEVFGDGVKVDAMTVYGEDIRVFVAWEILAPLLRRDLNDGERMAERVFVAKTVFHELMHVFHFAQRNFSAEGEYLGPDYYRSLEPFFEDEAEAELGLSAETAVFGGPIRPILTHNPGKTHLGFFMTSHPLEESGSPLYDVPRLRNPGAPVPSLFIPIPLSFYAALWEMDFWSVRVKKFGMGLLRVSEAVSGSWEVEGRFGVLGIEEFMEREVKRLMGMSPEEKEVKKRDLKDGLVAGYQPLTVKRDMQVREVMNSAEYLGKLEKGTGNYNFFLESVVEDLEALVGIHESIVAYFPHLEEDAGVQLVDPRGGVQAFHDHLRIYIASLLLPAEDEEIRGRLEDMIAQLDGLTSSSFIDAFDPNYIDDAKYHLQSYETVLLEALQAFDEGDFTRCDENCKQLTETLDVPIHLQAMARVKLAEMEHVILSERLENVRRAMSIFQGLDLESVEEHLREPVVDFANRGAQLIGELEEQELEELRRGFARGCG